MKIPPIFRDAVSKLFQRWDVLHHAVESHFGGVHSREKAEWLPTVVVDFFARNADLEPSEVEHFISEIMDNEFDLVVEDGSLDRLSKQLCRCFAWARDKRDGELQDFLDKLPPLPAPQTKKVVNDDDSESDDEEEAEKDEKAKTEGGEPMEVDQDSGDKSQPKARNGPKPKSGPVVDEDGWTLVVGKKKH